MSTHLRKMNFLSACHFDRIASKASVATLTKFHFYFWKFPKPFLKKIFSRLINEFDCKNTTVERKKFCLNISNTQKLKIATFTKNFYYFSYHIGNNKNFIFTHLKAKILSLIYNTVKEGKICGN